MSLQDKNNKIEHIVIQSPDGEVHLCNIMNLDTDNDISSNSENNPIIETSPRLLNHCGVIYELTLDEYANKSNLIYYTRVVHIICSIEMMLYLFIIVTSNMFQTGFCFLIISLIGLDSTITYNRISVFIYLFYQYMQLISKFYILCSIFVTISSQDTLIHLTENKLMILRNQNGLTLLFIAMNFYQLFVTYSVHRLYQLLPQHRRLE